MRNKSKPFLFLSSEFDTLLKFNFLRPTKSAIKTKLLVYNGKKYSLSRVRPVFQEFKIKSFILNCKRGSHIRTFFKPKSKRKK